MTRTGRSSNVFPKKIVTISIFLLLGISSLFSQVNDLTSQTSAINNGWWGSIFKRHNIDLEKFNYKNTFDMGMNDTINNLWLEIGVSDSINNRNIPFRNAIIIAKDTGQAYWIIKSEYAHHDLDNHLLILNNGQMAWYHLTFQNAVPADTSSFQEMIIDIKKNSIKASSKE